MNHLRTTRMILNVMSAVCMTLFLVGVSVTEQIRSDEGTARMALGEAFSAISILAFILFFLFVIAALILFIIQKSKKKAIWKTPLPKSVSFSDCPSCGKKNKVGSKFCAYCGAELKDVPSEEVPLMESKEDNDDKHQYGMILRAMWFAFSTSFITLCAYGLAFLVLGIFAALDYPILNELCGMFFVLSAFFIVFSSYLLFVVPVVQIKARKKCSIHEMSVKIYSNRVTVCSHIDNGNMVADLKETFALAHIFYAKETQKEFLILAKDEEDKKHQTKSFMFAKKKRDEKQMEFFRQYVIKQK